MSRDNQGTEYYEDYYRGFSKLYFNRILDTIISFGELKEEKGLILDFGCGYGNLKKRLGKKNIVGYDIIPELTEIDDYKSLKPEKIVLSGVLEHLYLNEIDKLLDDFYMMNPKAVLLSYLPTENTVSKIAMNLANMKNAHDDHVSKYIEINRLVEKRFIPEKRRYVLFKMAQVTKYVPRVLS